MSSTPRMTKKPPIADYRTVCDRAVGSCLGRMTGGTLTRTIVGAMISRLSPYLGL
jgi:hypothetical protein